MVGRKETTYEESRRKRLEENKKRMEELNLNKLAQSLRTTATSPVTRRNSQLPYSLSLSLLICIKGYHQILISWIFLILQMKKIKPRTPSQPLDLSAVRRSSRVADKPPPSYREVKSLFPHPIIYIAKDPIFPINLFLHFFSCTLNLCRWFNLI